jgi:PAS domain S-box-containing protein
VTKSRGQERASRRHAGARRAPSRPWLRASRELATLSPGLQLVAGIVGVGATLALGVTGGTAAAAAGLVALALAGMSWALARVIRASEMALDEQREATAQVMSVLDRANDAFVSVDADGRVRAWNARAETMFGWSREEALGRQLSELIVPVPQREAHRNSLERYLSSHDGPALRTRIEITACRKDGGELPVELSVWPVATGRVPNFNAFIQDVSERHRVEQERAELASSLRVLLEESTEGILELDLDGRCTFINGAAAATLGVDARLVLGLDACNLLHRHADPLAHDDASCVIRRALQWGERVRAADEQLWRPDGQTLRAELRTYPTILDGRLQGVMVAFTPRVFLAPTAAGRVRLPSRFGWG